MDTERTARSEGSAVFAFAVLFSYNGCVNEDLGKGASGMEETNAFSETVIQQLQQALLAW